jgi:hypothetical protein
VQTNPQQCAFAFDIPRFAEREINLASRMTRRRQTLSRVAIAPG